MHWIFFSQSSKWHPAIEESQNETSECVAKCHNLRVGKKYSLKEKLAATGHQQKTALYANIWSAFKTKRWCTAQTPSCYAMRSVCLNLRASQKLLARLNAITYTEWMSVYLENSNRGYLFLGGPFALFIKQNCLFNRNLFYWSQLAIRNGPGLPFVIHFHSRGACHKGIWL